jgi:hypothetical protein
VYTYIGRQREAFTRSRPTPKHGEKVFGEEGDAVDRLIKLIDDKKSALDKGQLQSLVVDLAFADRDERAIDHYRKAWLHARDALA